MRGHGSWRQVRLWLALAVFAVTLALLIGGQGLAESLRVKRPLAHSLRAIPGIRDFNLVQEAGGARLELTLDRVADLERTLDEAVAAVQKHEQSEVKRILIQDRRKSLEGAYYTLRFSLEEAMATGRYTKLKGDLDRLAKDYRLARARVYLGARFIIVQLESGRAYLYEALPRQDIWGRTDARGGEV